MCHSIVERHSYLIVIILHIPTERKRFSTELALVYCFVLFDDNLQSASVLVELNDI